MKHTPLDIYDDMPSAMKAYVSNYGFNFSKKACDYAVKMMRRKNNVTGKEEQIEPYTKDQCEQLLQKYGIKLENDVLYNSTFVLNMAKAYFYKSSIEDEQHLALFVKDYIDDVDGSSEIPFRRWLSTMIGNGCPIEWEDIL